MNLQRDWENSPEYKKTLEYQSGEFRKAVDNLVLEIYKSIKNDWKLFIGVFVTVLVTAGIFISL